MHIVGQCHVPSKLSVGSTVSTPRVGYSSVTANALFASASELKLKRGRPPVHALADPMSGVFFAFLPGTLRRRLPSCTLILPVSHKPCDKEFVCFSRSTVPETSR